METEKKRLEKSRKLQSGKTSASNSKPVTEKQNKASSNLPKSTKPQKEKESEISVPKQGTKGLSSNALAKNRDKTDNNKNISKADANKEVNKKQARKRNKLSNLIQQLPVNERVKEGSGEPEKKNEQVIAQVSNKEAASKIENEDVSKKTGSEISKSKKRRIRKRRLLESLGISIGNPLNTDKSKNSKKKKKKKRNSKFVNGHEISNENLLNERASNKSGNLSEVIANGVVKRSKDSTCDNTERKGAIKKSEGIAEAISKANDSNISCNKKKPDVPKTKEIKLEKKVSETNVTEFKESKVSSDNSVSAKVNSNHQEIQQCRRPDKELSQPETRYSLEDTSHGLFNESNSDSSGKVDIVNFLSHDNVEGLFRSALLNDVTLSSRCSEKEVKNFFNTYGTFSERGRTQFATVEKLLNSTNKDNEDIATSQYFEPTLEKEISPSLNFKTLNTLANKESSCDINTLPVASVTTPKCEYLSPKIIKDSINTEEPSRLSPDGNSESELSYNQVVKGLNSDSVGNNNSVFKTNLCRGPIYTSPNLENRVTCSSNSNQIPNSTSRVFVSKAYQLPDFHQDKFINSCPIQEQETLAVNENQAFVKEIPSPNSSRDKDSSKEKSQNKERNFKEENSSQIQIASSGTKKPAENVPGKHKSTINLQSSLSTHTKNSCGSDSKNANIKDICTDDKNTSKSKNFVGNKRDTSVEKTDTDDKIVKNIPFGQKEYTNIEITSSEGKGTSAEDVKGTSKKSRETSIKSSYSNDKEVSPSLKKIYSEEKQDIKNTKTDNKESTRIEKTYINKTAQNITNSCTENKQDKIKKENCTTKDKEDLNIRACCTDKNNTSTTKDTTDFIYTEEKDTYISGTKESKESCSDRKNNSINNASSHKNNATTVNDTRTDKRGECTVKAILSDRSDSILKEGTCADKSDSDRKDICTERKGTCVNNIFTGKKNLSGVKTICSDKKDTSIKESGSCNDRTNEIEVKDISFEKKNTSVVKDKWTDRKDVNVKDTYSSKEDINVTEAAQIDKKDPVTIREITSDKKENTSFIKEICTNEQNLSGVKEICIEKKGTSSVKEFSTDKKDTSIIKEICPDKKNKSPVKEFTTGKKDTSDTKEICTGRKDTNSVEEFSTDEKNTSSIKKICIDKKDTSSVKEFSTSSVKGISADRKDKKSLTEFNTARKVPCCVTEFSIDETSSAKSICADQIDSSSVKEFNIANKDKSSVRDIFSDKDSISSIKEFSTTKQDTSSAKEICTDRKDTNSVKEISSEKDKSCLKNLFTDKKDTSVIKEIYTDKQDSSKKNTCSEIKEAVLLKDSFTDRKDTDIDDTLTDKKETSIKTISSDEKDTSIKNVYNHNQTFKSVKENSIDNEEVIKLKEISHVDEDIVSHKPEVYSKPTTEIHRRIDYIPKCSVDTQKTSTNVFKTTECLTPVNKEDKINSSQTSTVYKLNSEDNSMHNNFAYTSEKEKEIKSDRDITDNIETAVPVPILNISDVSACKLLDDNIMKLSQGKRPEGANNPKTEKTREEILAEREAKKAAKLAGKNKTRAPNQVLPKSDNTGTVSKTVSSDDKTAKPEKSSADTVKSNKFLESIDIVSRNKQEKTEDKSVPVKMNQMSQGKAVSALGKDDVQSKPESAIEKTEVTAGKSKAELRAERRAKQEAQRTAKATQQKIKTVQAKSVPQVPAESKEKSLKKEIGDDLNKKTAKVTISTIKPKTPEHRVKLFNHLYHERGPVSISESLMLSGPDLHPSIVKLGMQYADRLVVGSNARCIALLDALKQVIRDYETPPQKEFSRGLEAELQPSVAFLDTCRPLSVSMTNAFRHLLRQLTLLPNNVSDSEAKKKLLDAIDTYIREQIDMAAEAICIMVQRKIANGDVILTYGCSSLLQRILLNAHDSGTKFRVIVVDGRPWNEGREMLRRLIEHGLDCSYVLVSAASFIMREATKVLLGAHALLANGYVMSRAGSSQVALLAHSYNVPVLVCCETHKFCERVQTDSFVYNELGNPDDLIPAVSSSKDVPLSKWRGIGSLTPLNLTYDVTPPDLVSAVITELAILPCTSVPVILRIKPSEIGC